MTSDDSHFVQSFARGLSVISAFDSNFPTLSVSQTATRAGITRAAARRFLLTLVDLGYARTDGSEFALTPKVLRLGYSYLSGLDFTDVAEPHLEELSRTLGESTSASVLDDGEIIYVIRIASHRIMSVAINVGTRFPAHATAMGRVLLSGLSDTELDDYLAHSTREKLTSRTQTGATELRKIIHEVREGQVAFLIQELEPGLKSLAAPIHNQSGAIVAAINVSMRAGLNESVEADKRQLEELVPLVQGCAQAIESDLRNLRMRS